MHNYKFSLITPEHSVKNIPFLLELYDSIKKQTYDNWEWILYLNNGFNKTDLPLDILADLKVTIIEGESNPNIGYLKNKAFHAGPGDILVEVDHDDELVNVCLEKLNEAFQDESVGFCYSDNAVNHMEDKFIPYNEAYGWKHRMFQWKDKLLFAMNSFEPIAPQDNKTRVV